MNEYQMLVKKVYQEEKVAGNKIAAFELALEEAKQERIPYSVFKTARGAMLDKPGMTVWFTVENLAKFDAMFGQ